MNDLRTNSVHDAWRWRENGREVVGNANAASHAMEGTMIWPVMWDKDAHAYVDDHRPFAHRYVVRSGKLVKG